MKSKSAVQLIKYDQSPSAEGASDLSVDSGPGIHGQFSVSPERASNSSNFSESLNSDHSPENDLSPLARRRARVNRAHRQRIVRSEYFTPAMANSLALQGRSRSLDTKEFIRDVVQAQGHEDSPGHVSSSSSMTVLDKPSPSSSGDSARERKLSNDVNRTLSFSLARGDSARDSPAHVRRKSAETKVKKPPDYKPPVVNGKNSPLTRKKSGPSKVETETSTPERSPFIKERNQLSNQNGESLNLTKKKSPDAKVEEIHRAEISEESFPFMKKSSISSKVEATPENSPIWKKSVNNNLETTPGLPIWEDRLSRSSHQDDSSSGSRRVSESSRKGSDVSSAHSRTSSFTESDVSKTVVRHVGSTLSSSGGGIVEKRNRLSNAGVVDKKSGISVDLQVRY